MTPSTPSQLLPCPVPWCEGEGIPRENKIMGQIAQCSRCGIIGTVEQWRLYLANRRTPHHQATREAGELIKAAKAVLDYFGYDDPTVADPPYPCLHALSKALPPPPPAQNRGEG